MNTARRNSYYAGMVTVGTVGLGAAASSANSSKLLLVVLGSFVGTVAFIWVASLWMRRLTSRAVREGADYAAVFKIKGAIELFPEAATSRAAMTKGPGDVSGILILRGETVTLRPFKVGEQTVLEAHTWSTQEAPLLSAKFVRDFTGIPMEAIVIRIFDHELEVTLSSPKWPRSGNPCLADAWPGGVSRPADA